MLADDPFPAARCLAACHLARIEPMEAMIEPLLQFVSEPIEGYENIPGAGGKSTGDAAFSISHLPPEAQRKAIPKTLPGSEVFRFLFRECLAGEPARAARPELPHAP